MQLCAIDPLPKSPHTLSYDMLRFETVVSADADAKASYEPGIADEKFD
jgi:hypothetical protein